MTLALLLLLGCPAPDSDTTGETTPATDPLDADRDGWTSADGDCDDTDPTVHPQQAETWYDGVDSNCDGADDHDADADGHQAEASGGADCNDLNAEISPDADERCNGWDDDCDGQADEPDDRVDGETWYADADGDGHGDPATGTFECDPPPDHVANDTDCDDRDARRAPDLVEVCDDGLDNDCSGRDVRCSITDGGVLSDADLHWYSTQSYAEMGLGLDAGDYNGDGELDLAISAPEANGDGEVYLIWGPVTAGGLLPETSQRWEGPAHVGSLGDSLATAGDLDGDGLDDLVVGHTYASGIASLAGGASVLLGADIPPPGTLITASFEITGSRASAQVGYSVAGAGDFDGDGIDDVLIGAPDIHYAEPGNGSVLVLTTLPSGDVDYDSAGPLLLGELDDDEAGNSVASVGDVDGDGIDDVLVAAHDRSPNSRDEAGVVYLVLGPITTTQDLADADASWLGSESIDRLGDSVSTAGDQDGDGLPDALLGAYSANGAHSTSGIVYVVSGRDRGAVEVSASLARLEGGADDGGLGDAVACAGDVNGDGHDDLLLGSPGASAGADFEAGLAYVVPGPVSGVQVMGRDRLGWAGESDNDYAGDGVAGVGDVDGDGLDDVLIAASAAHMEAVNGGAVYLLYGAFE